MERKDAYQIVALAHRFAAWIRSRRGFPDAAGAGGEGAEGGNIFQARQGANTTERRSEGEFSGFVDGDGSHSGDHSHRAADSGDNIVGSWAPAIRYNFLYEVGTSGASGPAGPGDREFHRSFRDGKMRQQTQHSGDSMFGPGALSVPQRIIRKSDSMDRSR